MKRHAPAGVLRALLTSIVFFGLINVVLVVARGRMGGETFPLFYAFYLDAENTVPSRFSTLLLAAASLLWMIADLLSEHLFSLWRLLSLLFFGLSLDEAAAIHERLNVLSNLGGTLGAQGIFYNAWVLAVFPPLAVLAILYARFLLRLPTQVRTLFLFSGFLYVGGAVGMEMVGSLAGSLSGWNVLYGLLAVGEELLELLGISLFIYTLLVYLQPLLQGAFRS